jgi:hypothetical protein
MATAAGMASNDAIPMGQLSKSASSYELANKGGEHGGHHTDKKVQSTFMKDLLKFEEGVVDMPWFPPEKYIYYDEHHNVEIEYQLTIPQRIFVMLEDNSSSKLGAICAFVITTCIILGCICFILAEEPDWWDWQNYGRYGVDKNDNHGPFCKYPYDVVCNYMKEGRYPSYQECPVSPDYYYKKECYKYGSGDNCDQYKYIYWQDKGYSYYNYNATDYCSYNQDQKAWISNNPGSYDTDTQYCPDRQICKPHHDLTLELIEVICIFIFTVEYLTLVGTVWAAPSRLAHTMPHEWDDENHYHKPDPVYPWYVQYFSFFSSWKMLIDLATLLPFFILWNESPILGEPSGSGSSFNFIRVFRLLRILHIFKISRKNKVLNLVEKTMQLSMPTMILTAYVASINMIFWGSLIHYFENEEWRTGSDPETFAKYPNGIYMRRNHMDNSWEPSPFTSIAVGIYWVMMISTTTGVGQELQPTTDGGRFCAVLVACIGVILMAIPIGVVGLNFAQEWEKMKSNLLNDTNLGPTQRIKMSTSSVAVVAIDDVEGGAVVQQELSADQKMSMEIATVNTNINNAMQSIVSGQRDLAICHEQMSKLMAKLTTEVHDIHVAHAQGNE